MKTDKIEDNVLIDDTLPTDGEYHEFPDVRTRKRRRFMRFFSGYFWTMKYYDVTYAVKSSFFRALRGWCPADSGDVDVWFCSTAPEILRHLAKTVIGHPNNEVLERAKGFFPGQFVKSEDNFETNLAEWISVIKLLADLIQNSNMNTCLYKNEEEVVGEIFKYVPVSVEGHTGSEKLVEMVSLENPTFDKWKIREDEIEELVKNNRKIALTIFCDLMPHLWN